MTLELPTAQDTEEVAAVVASILLEPYFNTHPVTTTMASSRLQNLKGTICLDGDLGAGKTAFARGFLRAATGDEELRVTSPTYLLVNVYPILGGSLEYVVVCLFVLLACLLLSLVITFGCACWLT